MWTWVLQDPLGQDLSALAGARSRHFSFKRSTTPEATFELDLQHDDASQLEAALLAGGGSPPVLRCFRAEKQPDNSTLAVCRFGGIYGTAKETATTGIIEVTFRGAFETLEGRYTDDLFARDGTPAADIATDLLDLTETLDGPTGITVGDIELTEPRSVEYEARKNIASGIMDLTDFFDFEVVPLADADGGGTDLGRFDAWVQQGDDRPGAIFGYGTGTVGNCDEATRTTTMPRNRVIVTGDNSMFGIAEDTSSIDRYGVWTYVASMSDITDQGILDMRAESLLQPTPVRVVTFTPNPELDTTPVPGVDYWLGDTGRLSIRKGSFNYDGEPRLDGIDIDLDEDGFESSHSVTVATDDNTTS